MQSLSRCNQPQRAVHQTTVATPRHNDLETLLNWLVLAQEARLDPFPSPILSMLSSMNVAVPVHRKSRDSSLLF